MEIPKEDLLNPVRETTKKVVENAKHVRINRDKIEELALQWHKSGLPIRLWDRSIHLQTDDQEKMLTYLLMLDSLNFCFWSPKNTRWAISYRGKEYTGYFGLSLALREFFETHPDAAKLEYWEKISWQDFLNLFQGGKNLLYLKTRWQIVRNVSAYLLETYGEFSDFISAADHKLSTLVPRIARELPSFNDYTFYDDNPIYLRKRAQILAIDIYGAFDGGGVGHFEDLDYATAFPDYKLPQIFEHLQIFEYTPKLRGRIAAQKLIRAGSPEEIEIRSATVWAVEYLKEALRKYGGTYHSFQLDWILWEESEKQKLRLPHHRTKTVFY